MASISAVELAGPCRFGGFDAHGMPVAIPHSAPWVQIAAVSRDQTRNTMTLFPGMLSPALVNECSVDIGKEIIYAHHGRGRIEAVTSSPRALEGGRPSLVVANEPHHWLQNNDGLEMAQAIRRNLAKSRDGSARVVEITNAHLPGEGSAAEATYDAWVQSGGRLPGVYYDSLEAPPLDDITDTAGLRAGLLAARGDSVWLDIDRIIEEIRDPVTPESLSRRFYLNQVVANVDRWLPEDAWDACKDTKRVIPDGADVVLAFDGSFDDDSTALMVCSVDEVPHLDVVEAWERPLDGPHDFRVPIVDVEDAIRFACRRWQVREIACDPFRWARTLQILEAEGLPVVEFPQNPARMLPATSRFADAVHNKSVTHSGDERLARHIANARLKVDSRGARLAKDARKSPRKIDLAVAAVMALDRASQVPPEETPHVW